MEFTLNIQVNDRNPFVILTLEGSLAGPTVYELKHECNRLIDYLGRNYVVLDLTKITFIDSAGIGVITHAYQACKQLGGRLAVVNPAEGHGLQTLYQTSLQRLIDFYPDAKTALTKTCEKCGLNVPADLAVEIGEPAEKSLAEKVDELAARVAELESQLKLILPQLAPEAALARKE